MVLIALSALMPWLVFRQPSRRAGFAVAAAYFGGANWPIIPATLGFYDAKGTLALGAAFWVGATALQAVPWMLRSQWSYLVSVVPPFGIIGWASPLTAAGVLFPGLGWLGVAALVLLPIRLGLATAVIANIAFSGLPNAPAGWQGVNTRFGRITELKELAVGEAIQRTVQESSGRVLVFPEFVVPKWTESTEAFWPPFDKTVLVGVGLPMGRTQKYDNVLLARGAAAPQPFRQRIPVPIVMWKPFRDEGVPMRPFGPATITIGGERAAVLICYEQLLTWPILTAMLQRPTLIAGIANDHWAAGTPIAAVQESAVSAWARLFRLPKITATNF